MGKIITKAKNVIAPLILYNTPQISQPVFILSAPRSGSTHLYEILRRCDYVVSLDTENDAFWWSLFPYSRSTSPSDYISASEVSTDAAKRIKAALALYVGRELYQQDLLKFFKLHRYGKQAHYLEKTIANCFHLEVLIKLFPEAKFIHLVRDGRSTISSMIEVWKSKRFMQRPLPFPQGASIDYWTFPIPPGWESVTKTKLNEICAWSWLQHNQFVLDFFEAHSALQEKFIRVSYEKLISEPETTADRLISFCGLKKSPLVESYIHSNQSSRTTVSKPKPMKWKTSNAEAILEIESAIAPMMTYLGY